MTTEQFQRDDKRLLLVVAAVIAVSVAYTVLNYRAAFPEASIDLRLSKAEITSLAAQFLQKQGLSTAGFRNLTLFDPDQDAQIYLERELGLPQANRLMQSDVAVWRWRARWFRPPSQEEMVVYLSPRGTVVGFDHVIPEAAPGARLDQETARHTADAFLARRTQAPQRIVEERLQQRPARYDYRFTWEQENFRAKDATYRRTIVVQGDKVGRYLEYLYVPEKWKRDFATLRSSNDLYFRVAGVLYVLLGLAAVVVLIQSLRQRVIRWRPLLLIAGAVGVLMVINEWNSIPFAIDNMPASSPYSQSLLRALLAGLGSGFGVFFYVILAAAPGEPLYRASLPSRISLLQWPSRRAIRTREFFRSTVIGYGFAAFHLAFVVAFYLVGRRFGVWSPQDVNYSDFLSTRLPWIYPMTIALLASTSEEFWFRLLAIPLLKRYLRSTWLAVVIPAFLWGFLHANYPQQPGYIRGVEVGIIGVAAGFLMLRFGILTTLVWHYTVDAVMIGMFLFNSGSLYFQLSGLAVAGAVLFPLAASLVYYQRKGGFLADPSLLNSGQALPVLSTAPGSAETLSAAEPLPPRWPVKWLYAGAALAALVGLAVPGAQEFGDFIRVRILRPKAEAVAARELQSQVPNLGDWRRVTYFQSNIEPEEFEYVRRLAGAAAANQAVKDHTATGLWVVRYFQPLRKEEWRAYVNQQGQVYRVDHLLDEKAPGARLSPDQALRLAESYLAEKQGVQADRYRLVDSSNDRRDRRTDYGFVWEDPAFHLGEARARISLSILGDEPSAFHRFLKLPEQWVRDFEKPRLASILLPAAVGAAGLILLVLLIRRLTQSAHRYRWRSYLALGVLGAGLSAASSINQWPLALAGYDTATPFDSYMSQFLLVRGLAVVIAGFALFFAALSADVFLQWAEGERSFRRPSLLRAAAACGLLWGLTHVAAGIRDRIPGPRVSLSLWQLPGAGTYSPAVSVLGQAAFYTLLSLCSLVVIVSALRFLAPARRYALIGLAAGAIAAPRAQTPAQFIFYFAAACLAAGLVIILLKTCGTDLWTFAVALFWLMAVEPAVTLIGQPAPFLRWNGVACLLAALCAGGLLVVRTSSAGARRLPLRGPGR